MSHIPGMDIQEYEHLSSMRKELEDFCIENSFPPPTKIVYGYEISAIWLTELNSPLAKARGFPDFFSGRYSWDVEVGLLERKTIREICPNFRFPPGSKEIFDRSPPIASPGDS